MKLIFTNAFGNKGEVEQKEIDVKGKCIITNYDTRTKSPENKRDLTVKVDEKNSSIMVGQEEQEDSTTVNMNAKKYSIFTILASLDGKEGDLTQDDIAKAKDAYNNEGETRNKLLELGVTEIRYDSHAGVATIVIGDKELLRIDFQTWRERLGIRKDSSTLKAEESNTVVEETPSDVTAEEVKEESEGENVEIKPYESFVDSVAYRESSGRVSKINSAGYVGLFQIGEQALADIGIYSKKSKKYNNDWNGTFKKNIYGITSLSDFKNSAEKQKSVFKAILKNNWDYIHRYGLDRYIGDNINGHVITESGLLAGAHLVGVNGLKKYIESEGKTDVKDGNGVSVSEYIDKFAGYDMSDITGVAPGTKAPEMKYEDTSYVVESGDNLSKIAERFNTTVDRIIERNNLKKNAFLHIGDTLIVPEGKPVV